MRSRLLPMVFAALSAVPLDAHDLWIEPSSFAPAAGAIVSVRLRVGQDLIGDPVARDPALISDFIVEDGEGRRPVIGRTGSDPAGLVRVTRPGLALIGYHSHPSRVELTGEKFDRYLKEEGLDGVAALRRQRGESGAVKEMFSRCAKSLVVTEATDRTQADRALGCTLELVAERNPYALYSMRAGEALPIRLTYLDKPFAGALVVAMNRANPTAKLSARSDAAGRVRFRLPRGGMWLVKAVHMIQARPGTNADWESFWASLTFDVPEGANDTTAVRR